MPGGARLEAGKLDTNATNRFVTGTFSTSFPSPPAVVTSVMTFTGGQAVTTRVNDVATSSFRVMMREQEAQDNVHALETIGYIAWEPGSGTVNDSLAYEVGTADEVADAFSSITFSNVYSSAPCILADMNTTNGGDTANLRWKNKDTSSVDVQVDEEQSRDAETRHVSEKVIYFAFACTPTPEPDPMLVGAGDIALCGSSGDEATAQLLDAIFAGDAPGNVFTAGDNAYNSGTASEFADCYDPTWGRHKARTKLAPGNHDYLTANASGYFGYFGAAAGGTSKGYYSYDLGSWHIVVINSNCSEVGGCGVGSPQEQWLHTDLAANPAACTLAYWHHPRFSSGSHGSSTLTQAIWQALYDYDAEVVINGHDHDYERFAPQDPNGVADPTSGIRQFVVGTGGKSHYSFGVPIANSEVRNGDTYGVLKMTLHSTSFDWEFVPEAGMAFTDSGSQSCH